MLVFDSCTLSLKLLSRLRNNGSRRWEQQTVSHVWVCYVRSSEITCEASWLCLIYWRGSCATHVFFFRCTSCKEVETSIPVKQGCTEFVISHKEHLQIAFKRVLNLKLMFWFLHYFRGVDSYRKGNSNDVPYQYVLNGREIREPSGHGGQWRGHSVKAYVFAFFIA